MKKTFCFLLICTILLALLSCQRPTQDASLSGYLINIYPRSEYELTEENVETLEAVLNDAMWREGRTKLACHYQFCWSDRVIQYNSKYGVVHDLMTYRFCELTEEDKNAINEIIQLFCRWNG